jgi:cytoskeleton protein RodZ
VTSKSTKSKGTTASTVGQTLKGRRLARHLSLKQAELATRIRGKYLLAIEADDYLTLPHDVYSRGFVQSYADYLELDGAKIVADYIKERGQQELQLRRTGRLFRPRLVLTPRLLTLVGGSIAALAIAAYLVWQFSALTAPPQLVVANPNRDQVLYGSLITVSGHVDDGANVFVNASPILVDGNGNFTDAIALQDGVNNLNVSATNPLGKTTTVTRNILAHVPTINSSNTLPTAPFNGVAVSVQVQGVAATLTVRIDGKPAFQGTMLPGTTQTFKGTNTVVVSTSNAGATHLTVTNATTANQNLGSLGTTNQPKNDFEFTANTQFQ